MAKFNSLDALLYHGNLSLNDQDHITSLLSDRFIRLAPRHCHLELFLEKSDLVLACMAFLGREYDAAMLDRMVGFRLWTSRAVDRRGRETFSCGCLGSCCWFFKVDDIGGVGNVDGIGFGAIVEVVEILQRCAEHAPK